MNVKREMQTRPSRNARTFVLGAAALLLLGLGRPAQADGAPGADAANSNNHLVRVQTSLHPASTVDADPTLALAAPASDTSVSHVFAARRQAPIVSRFVETHLRLGAVVNPRIKFDGGIDFTFPTLGLGNAITTRVDIDAILDANLGGISTLLPVTIDQVYTRNLAGTTLYAGAGLGGFFGKYTRFGGKLFVGGGLGGRLSLEGAVLFPGFGEALFTVQARLPLF